MKNKRLTGFCLSLSWTFSGCVHPKESPKQLNSLLQEVQSTNVKPITLTQDQQKVFYQSVGGEVSRHFKDEYYEKDIHVVIEANEPSVFTFYKLAKEQAGYVYVKILNTGRQIAFGDSSNFPRWYKQTGEKDILR